jgi:hypothetical protein
MQPRHIARVDLHLGQQRGGSRHEPYQGLGFLQHRARRTVRHVEYDRVLGCGHHGKVVAQLRLREPRRCGVAVAARLGHLLGQFALPFLDKAVAIGLGLGDLLSELLLFPEIGFEAGLGVDQPLARVEQLELAREILDYQLLVDALRLAR